MAGERLFMINALFTFVLLMERKMYRSLADLEAGS